MSVNTPDAVEQVGWETTVSRLAELRANTCPGVAVRLHAMQ